MAKNKISDLPPRYSFILNPYPDVRLSKCPKCDRPTFLRKFALFIDVEQYGPFVLGKTCRYCARCELIIVHQDELEAELANTFARLDPKVIGNKYLVLGTLDKKAWQKGLQGEPMTLADSFKHLAEFKEELDLKVTGGWGPA